MSTKAEMVLEEIRALPPLEFQAVWLQVSRMAAESGKAAPTKAQVSDEAFQAALDEVTGEEQPAAQRESIRRGRGLLAGGGLLEALLADRAKERARE